VRQEFGTVERAVVRVKADSAETLAGRAIVNHMAARFSLPYAVASALIRRGCAPDHYDEPAIRDREVLGTMDRVEVRPDPELTRFHETTGGFPAIVEIVAGGRMVEARVDYPLGSAERPMTRAMLRAKFDGLTAGAWSEGGRREIHSLLAGLADLDDVGRLMQRIGDPKATAAGGAGRQAQRV